MRDILFTVFGIFTIGAAMGVVFSRSAIFSALSLILSFFGLAGIFILWGNSFLAMLQILIYTGAIVVLFVFVVMLLEVGRGRGLHAPRPLLAVVGGAATWLISLLLLRTLNYSPFFSGQPAHKLATDMRTISRLLFNEYLWPFEVLSLFLFALIIAIFILARPEADQGGQA